MITYIRELPDTVVKRDEVINEEIDHCIAVSFNTGLKTGLALQPASASNLKKLFCLATPTLMIKPALAGPSQVGGGSHQPPPPFFLTDSIKVWRQPGLGGRGPARKVLTTRVRAWEQITGLAHQRRAAGLGFPERGHDPLDGSLVSSAEKRMESIQV